MSQAKITIASLKEEYKKCIFFFKSREGYKKQLRRAINKYGIVNLPDAVQRTIPTDMKVLYELPWYLNVKVWIYIFLITWHRTNNEVERKVLNVGM